MSDNKDLEFNITFFEACEILNRSRKSVSRYIRRGLLHPQEIKSGQGTLEYRFSKEDLNNFREDKTGQDETGREGTGQDNKVEIPKSPIIKEVPDETRRDEPRPPETGQDNDLVPFLKDQIKIKDKQIEVLGGHVSELIERNRETNILLQNSLQEKSALGPGRTDETAQDVTPPDETGDEGKVTVL